ncbi:thioredoxin-like protein [Phascolomyces articulosus]|uniref:Thioredoxin-like protein n=1 Tax=Phascolomyces articulosus TaxID=60185 RepID=A0AAD5KPF5_9FUNG|nr:thioredoxin-like protein [Phascolomyces articulosus]
MLLLRILALLSFIATLSFAQVTEVTDDNVGSLIGKSDEWVLEFYADWCGYCRKFAPKYEAAQRVLASSPTSHNVGVGKVNVETSPGLAARFFVQRLPTIVHIKDHEVRVIPADRMNDLVNIVQDQLWQEFQPVNGMTSPFSVM